MELLRGDGHVIAVEVVWRAGCDGSEDVMGAEQNKLLVHRLVEGSTTEVLRC
jgi:hypothetical protein